MPYYSSSKNAWPTRNLFGVGSRAGPFKRSTHINAGNGFDPFLGTRAAGFRIARDMKIKAPKRRKK